MARLIFRRWVVVIGVAVLGISEASAQAPAASFEQLRSCLTPGDLVFLTDAERRVSKGTLVELSGTSLRLLVDGMPRDFVEADVSEIDRQSSDSVLNGLLLGAAVGGAIFLKYYSENALCQANCQFVSGALSLIAIGGAVGAGIDALVAQRKPVFRLGSRTRPGAARQFGLWFYPQGALGLQFSF